MNTKIEEIAISAKKTRLHFLDVAKGLLIMMVVYSHIQWLCSGCGYTVNGIWDSINKFGVIAWVPFYMPCFFIISGMCSNFNKNFKEFITGKILTLLFPMVIISFSNIWFLWTLFNAFLLNYFAIRIIKKKLIVLAIFIVFSILCSYLSSIDFIVNCRRYYLLHSLGMCIYLYLGYLVKGKVNNLLTYKLTILALLLYGSAVLYGWGNDWNMPAIHSVYMVSIYKWPLHIYLTITGSVLLLGISKIINQNRVLEFYGRNSLLIFLLHGSCVIFIVKILYNIVNGSLLFALLFLLTLLSLSILSLFFNTKWFSWLLGKFK